MLVGWLVWYSGFAGFPGPCFFALVTFSLLSHRADTINYSFTAPDIRVNKPTQPPHQIPIPPSHPPYVKTMRLPTQECQSDPNIGFKVNTKAMSIPIPMPTPTPTPMPYTSVPESASAWCNVTSPAGASPMDPRQSPPASHGVFVPQQISGQHRTQHGHNTALIGRLIGHYL